MIRSEPGTGTHSSIKLDHKSRARRRVPARHLEAEDRDAKARSMDRLQEEPALVDRQAFAPEGPAPRRSRPLRQSEATATRRPAQRRYPEAQLGSFPDLLSSISGGR